MKLQERRSASSCQPWLQLISPKGTPASTSKYQDTLTHKYQHGVDPKRCRNSNRQLPPLPLPAPLRSRQSASWPDDVIE